MRCAHAQGMTGPRARRGLFVDAAGRIYVADTGNHRIVRITGMTGAGWTTVR
jgi:NHL repeat-containing protein